MRKLINFKTAAMITIVISIIIAFFALSQVAVSQSRIENRASSVSQSPSMNYNVHGVVYKQGTSDRVSNAYLQFKNTSSMQMFDTYSDSSGNYQISLSEGSYTIQITASGYQSYSHSQAITVASSDVNQDFYIQSTSNNGGGGGGMGDIFSNLSLPKELEWVMYGAMAFCFGVPILLLLILIVLIAVFVRTGKVKKGIDNLEKKQSAPQQQQQPFIIQTIPAQQPIVQAPPNVVMPPPAGTGFCTGCGRQISPEYMACPYCGAVVKK